MADPQLIADRDFWVGVRQNLLSLVALVERKLGWKPTTKQKGDFWKQCHFDTTHTSPPDWETDTT